MSATLSRKSPTLTRICESADLPCENACGHTKKLCFLLDAIDAFRRQQGRPVTVLDFGCGNGMAVSRHLIERCNSFYGVDIHEPSLAFARQRWSQPNAQFLNMLPTNVNFDVIVYADILEHLDDPIAFLRAHQPQLLPDGIVIGAVPNGYGNYELENRLVRWFGISAVITALRRTKRRLSGQPPPEAESQCYAGELVPYNTSSGHVQFFTQGTLKATLHDGGFELKILKPAAFLSAPLISRLLLHGQTMMRWNARVADFLPLWMASAWFFVATKRG
jgi:SAM-dependent methyltransferase